MFALSTVIQVIKKYFFQTFYFMKNRSFSLSSE